MTDLLERLVRPEIRALSAYHVPDSTGLIKLDAMENPYTWPDDLRREWLDLLAEVDVNRYPDPQGRVLQATLRDAMCVPAEMAIMLGNGSDELIQMLALTVAGPGRKILSVDPGFVMYRMIGLYAGMRYIGVPLCPEDFSLDLPAVLDALDREQPALTFLAYPNNPTGNLFETAAIERIIEAAPGLVVVDEAYAPFTDKTFMHRLGEWPNLLVMRTVSKLGLAGLRLGLLAGPKGLLAEIDKTRLPYNINVLTQVSATFALQNRGVFEQQTRWIREERVQLLGAVNAIEGVEPFPSDANFILFRVPTGTAMQAFDGLREAGVLVKKLDGAHPMLADCLRVTIGKPEENQAFIEALRSLIDRSRG